MPSKSAKQARFMAAVANNPKFAKKAGVPTSVGKEFAEADKGRKFKRGGPMPSYFKSSSSKPGKAVKKYSEGKMVSKAHREKALRNIDDEIYRIAPKTHTSGNERKDAREEYGRLLKEQGYERRHMNKGGKVKKQGYNDRLDESLGARNGKKSQSLKSRRDESKGMEKAMGKGAYSGASTMMKKGGKVQTKKDRSDESKGSKKPRGWGKAQRGWAGRYDRKNIQR